MSERERRRFHYDREQELRKQPAEPSPEADAPRRRVDQQSQWVDLQVQAAIQRGEFDNLPGAGKPLAGLDPTGTHDPDWWVKQLIAREQITGVLPPALQLRKDDAELDAQLDREAAEVTVRRLLADFNRRVVDARRQLAGGPPVVTPVRDVDAEVAAWRQRWEDRRTTVASATEGADSGGSRRWWQRRRA